MIGDHADVFQSQVDQDLGANAAFVLHHALAGRFAIELAARVEMNLRKRARRFGRVDGEAAAGVMQVQENAAPFVGNFFQGLGDEFGAIAGKRTEYISRQAVRMYANERWRGADEFATNQGDVLIVIDVAGIGDHAEIAETCGQNRFGYAANVALVVHAVADQVRNREHLQIVFAAEFQQLRHARHGAVFIHDFADHASGSESGDARKIDGSFGLPCADEHATVARAKGEHVAGARQILRARFGIDRGKNGDGAVRGADAGGDAELWRRWLR